VKSIKAISVSLAVIILVILVVQNLEVLTKPQVFRINLLFATYNSPPIQIYLLLLICIVVGFILAYLPGLIQRRHMKKTIKILNQSQKQTEMELNSLRNLPITESRIPGESDLPRAQEEE